MGLQSSIFFDISELEIEWRMFWVGLFMDKIQICYSSGITRHNISSDNARVSWSKWGENSRKCWKLRQTVHNVRWLEHYWIPQKEIKSMDWARHKDRHSIDDLMRTSKTWETEGKAHYDNTRTVPTNTDKMKHLNSVLENSDWIWSKSPLTPRINPQ